MIDAVSSARGTLPGLANETWGEWIAPGIFRNASGEWLTTGGAEMEFGMCGTTLRHYLSGRCRWPAGIVVCKRRVRRGKSKVRVIHRGTLEALAEFRRKHRQPGWQSTRIVIRDAGGEWFSRRAAERKFGIPASTLEHYLLGTHPWPAGIVVRVQSRRVAKRTVKVIHRETLEALQTYRGEAAAIDDGTIRGYFDRVFVQEVRLSKSVRPHMGWCVNLFTRAGYERLEALTVENIERVIQRKHWKPCTKSVVRSSLNRLRRHAIQKGRLADPLRPEKYQASGGIRGYFETVFQPKLDKSLSGSTIRGIRWAVSLFERAGFSGLEDLTPENIKTVVAEARLETQSKCSLRCYLNRVRRYAIRDKQIPAAVEYDPTDNGQWFTTPAAQREFRIPRGTLESYLGNTRPWPGGIVPRIDHRRVGRRTVTMIHRGTLEALAEFRRQHRRPGWRSAMAKARLAEGRLEAAGAIAAKANGGAAPIDAKANQTVPTVANANGQATGEPPEAGQRDSMEKPRKKPGPKKARYDTRADKRNWEAWKSGAYETKGELAREKGITERELLKSLERHRARQKRLRRA